MTLQSDDRPFRPTSVIAVLRPEGPGGDTTPGILVDPSTVVVAGEPFEKDVAATADVLVGVVDGAGTTAVVRRPRAVHVLRLDDSDEAKTVTVVYLDAPAPGVDPVGAAERSARLDGLVDAVEAGDGSAESTKESLYARAAVLGLSERPPDIEWTAALEELIAVTGKPRMTVHTRRTSAHGFQPLDFGFGDWIPPWPHR
jgi:hypothetical protein